MRKFFMYTNRKICMLYPYDAFNSMTAMLRTCLKQSPNRTDFILKVKLNRTELEPCLII